MIAYKEVVLIVVLLITISLPCQGIFDGVWQKTKDVFKVGGRSGKAVVQSLPNLIPTPDEIMEFGRQAVLGYPLEAISSAISSFCQTAVTSNATMPDDPAQLESINFVLLTEIGNVSVPVMNSAHLWSHYQFQKDLDLIVLITGWLSNINETNEAVDRIYEAYKKRGNYNFVVVDSGGNLNNLYSWSAFNTDLLGDYVARGLVLLTNYFPVWKIHLIGHSLGAHTAGAAGRYFQFYKPGFSLIRITGLDPANPCFNEGEALNGLSRGDAIFVDVIHSNSNVLGKKETIGDADFYPNGLKSVQPGCITIVCSHSRAWEYYAESVIPGNEYSFMATKCNSLASVLNGSCKMKKIPMGFAVPPNAKGNFFLQTNSKAPFGIKTNI